MTKTFPNTFGGRHPLFGVDGFVEFSTCLFSRFLQSPFPFPPPLLGGGFLLLVACMINSFLVLGHYPEQEQTLKNMENEKKEGKKRKSVSDSIKTQVIHYCPHYLRTNFFCFLGFGEDDHVPGESDCSRETGSRTENRSRITFYNQSTKNWLSPSLLNSRQFPAKKSNSSLQQDVFLSQELISIDLNCF